MTIGNPGHLGKGLELFDMHNELLVVSLFLSYYIIERFEQSARDTRNITTK